MELDAEQVKKALECCTEIGGCCECPYAANRKGCKYLLFGDSLALITSQEQRIKELEAECKQWQSDWETNHKRWEIACDKLKVENARLTEENERLRACTNLIPSLDEVKADNVSEIKTRFAMRFGTYTDKDMIPITEVFRLLDQIAKEMLEGK